jgi:hypothetical protein
MSEDDLVYELFLRQISELNGQPGDTAAIDEDADPLDAYSGTARSSALTPSSSKSLGALLQSLETYISTNGVTKYTLTGPGSLVFTVESQQRFAASIYAVAKPSPGYGAYDLRVDFAAQALTVPLPAGAWLLLSGVAGLTAMRRRRRDAQA